MTVTLLIWFPQTILCFTNYKTKRKPYHRSKLDSQSINCFVTLISNFSLQEKEEEAWNFCWKHWRPTKVHGRPQEGVLHAAQQILPDHQKKLALVLLSGASFSSSQTLMLSQKMLIRFGKKHFDFLEECVMLPKQKMELALKISQNPKKFWIIKPPGWSFICGVKMLKVFSAEAPMQILHCVTQSCSYSYFSSIFFSQIYE